MKESDFYLELVALINKYSMENGSDTPDYILADYLMESLGAFNRACVWRSRWHRTEMAEVQSDAEPEPTHERGHTHNTRFAAAIKGIL